LFKDKREIESLVARDGSVLFKTVKFSRYKIKVQKQNSTLGEITLDLRKA